MIRTPRIAAQQLTLDGRTVTYTRFKFLPGQYDALRKIAEEHRMECEFHYEHLHPPGPAVLYIRPDKGGRFWGRGKGAPINKVGYFDPWSPVDQIEPDYEDTACRFCEDYGLVSEHDFGPQYCERCERDVIQRCPQNGWRGYFTSDPEYPDELCCVGCAQRFYKENGIPRVRFESLDGFRVPCDFYNWGELEDDGFTEHETYAGRRIADDPDGFRLELLALIDAGNQIIIDQGATGIGNGYPDTVTVYTRKVAA